MTVVYFIRHAEPNYENHDDIGRELTNKGREDSKLVTRFFGNKAVDMVFSSPYKRSVDTIKGIAEDRGRKIILIDDFRERKIDSVWIKDYTRFAKQQWEDFDYKLSDGETLREVQYRNIEALNSVLFTHKNRTIIIGSHGTALGTIINYYDKSFNYEEFEKIRPVMPWIVKFNFDGMRCMTIEKINLFES